jgi:hypothetical protein
MPPTTKTILIAGNQGGGQFKSTTIASLADSLQTLGYSTKTIAIDRDSSPSTLQRLCPDTVRISANNGGATAAMEAAYDSTEDIVIIDSPSGFAENFANPELLPTEGGTRIVVGVIIDAQSEHSLECGFYFANALFPLASDYLILAVNDGWAINHNAKNILESPGWQELVKLAEGRVIEFPAYSQLMRRDHNAQPAVPSVHIANATNVLAAYPWRSYHNGVTQSVSQHAEWLVGKNQHLVTQPTSQKPHIEKENPAELLCLMAAETASYYDEIKDLIQSTGVTGITPRETTTGEIFVYDLEQALLRVPAHRYDSNIESLKLLLSYNLRKEIVTQALKKAVAKSQINSVRLLLDYGADPNHLDEAAAAGDTDAIDALIAAEANINLASKAVGLAAQNGRTKTLQLLIDMGFPYDLQRLGHQALLSNNPPTLDAVRNIGVQYSAADLDDEDVQMCPKSIDYLVSLGIPRPHSDEEKTEVVG